MKVGLAIGGSSTTGAAGVEADVKTFAAFGVHSAVVITTIASQNTKGVQQVFPLPPHVVAQQIDSVFSDMKVEGVKVGLVGNERNARIIFEELKRRRVGNVVFDPVMSAQSDGSLLVDEETVEGMRRIAGISKAVTPNAFEAEKLTGVKVKSIRDAEKAAEILKSGGAEAVVVKGVRVGRMVFDVMLHYELLIAGRRVVPGGTHGGGCCFSSALAACLINGLGVEDSFEETEKFMDSLIGKRIRIGRGIKAVNPLHDVEDSERWKVIQNLKQAVEEIENCREFSSLIPEVGTNIVYAIPKAKGVGDVAGVVGRIRNAMGKPKSLGRVEFGASSHLARAVLKMMEFEPSRRAAVNVKLSEGVIKKIKRMGLVVSSYERGKQPSEVKRKEGMTIPWGVEFAVRKKGKIPDAVYHEGEFGKEPSLIIFGKDAVSVARIAVKLPKG